MRTRTDESPPRQQDRAAKPSRRPKDELRSFETEARPRSGDPDTDWTTDPGINTHGSER